MGVNYYAARVIMGEFERNDAKIREYCERYE